MSNFIRYFGFALLAAAAVVAIYIILTIFQLLYEPESVEVVRLTKEFLSAQFPIFATDIDGVKNQIEIDPSARLFMVFFVGAIALVALSSLMSALVKGGLALPKYSQEASSNDS